MFIVELVGYGLTLAIYLALAALLLFSWRGSRISVPLLFAALTTAAWGGVSLAAQLMPQVGMLNWLVIADVARNTSLIALLLTVLSLGGWSRLGRTSAAIATILLAMSALIGTGWVTVPATFEPWLNPVIWSLAIALLGLILVEQVYRNARPKERDGARFFCTGIGLAFVCDMFLYSHGLLVGELPEAGLLVRAYFFAAGAPLIAVAAQRASDWNVGIFVSRRIVFYSSSLLAVGGYLVAMASVGYLIRSVHSVWGVYLQLFFFTAAIGTLIWILFSDQLRATLKVWLHKNFYENRYDYREEWLRLISTLAADPEARPIGVRAVQSLAQIVDSPGGVLWTLTNDGSCFRAEMGYNHEVRATEVAVDHPLIEFLDSRRWVLDLAEVRATPENYESLLLDDAALLVGRECLLVPLQHETRLLGFVELMPGTRWQQLNYEDHDLLKTAGQQIASYLEQSRVATLLGESRQFEAFSKFTAFVMHDLKNLIAQQSLMLQNAEKHKANPAFVDDAFQTIANSVKRMQGLLDQLRTRSELGVSKRLLLRDVVSETVAAAASRMPAPVVEGELPDCRVHADPERLHAVIGHILRNAQEATADDGKVWVSAELAAGVVHISICDDGSGMAADFVRDQLFQPFVSTKGSQGMGIGAYQAREYFTAMGGGVTVVSEKGQGTRFTLSLPVEA